MISSEETTRLESVIPGVVDAYTALRSTTGQGILTSAGSFYNHTIFGRDSSMTAKFICEFDPEAAREVIRTLASLQGVADVPQTQEEPGRIHHEWRDFTKWHGSLRERLLLWPWKHLWGASRDLLLTYFATDSTASYIRLIHKYATMIDRSILSEVVVDKSGVQMTIAESVERACAWLLRHTEQGVVMTVRTNRFSLPFQTYQDSITAYTWRNRTLAKYQKPMGYIENQAFAADALYDACDLLPESAQCTEWYDASRQIRATLFSAYHWYETSYPASAIDSRGPLDRHGIAPGWALNTSVWEEKTQHERAADVRLVVEQLFSADFLTPVGLRTRALREPAPLNNVAEYHGRMTVWPMFTFMVIEGLKRHHLYKLAEQLTFRLLNGLNTTGNFDEFFLVNLDGEQLMPSEDKHSATLPVQMVPEKRIAFSVVPAMVMAQRVTTPAAQAPQEPWQAQLETDILAQIETVSLLTPEAAKQRAASLPTIRLKRLRGGLATGLYFIRESLRRT